MALIKPEMIPDEVVEAALRAYSGNTCECSSCRKAVIRTIAAAFNAWPGALHSPDEVIDGELLPPIISLPFKHKGDA